MVPRPSYMEEANDKLYMVDPDNGVFVFDLFGTPLRTLPITGARHVDVREGAVWYVAGNQLLRYDLLTMATETGPRPAPAQDETITVVDARIEHGRLYRLTADRILVDKLR